MVISAVTRIPIKHSCMQIIVVCLFHCSPAIWVTGRTSGL